MAGQESLSRAGPGQISPKATGIMHWLGNPPGPVGSELGRRMLLFPNAPVLGHVLGEHLGQLLDQQALEFLRRTRGAQSEQLH